MKSDLLATFLELSEYVATIKRQKYGQMRAYYQKHYGKESFRQEYYDQQKFDFETIEKMEYFFNRLSQDFPLLAKISETVGTLKEKEKSGQPVVEYIQLWLPLVPVVKNLGNCYLINLLKMEEPSYE